MKNWHPQRYKQQAVKNKTSSIVIDNALKIGTCVTENSNAALPIFTLAHLAKQSNTYVKTLDRLISRKPLNLENPNYRVFTIKKKSAKKSKSRTPSDLRYICVPCKELHNVQSFINKNILLKLECHKSVVSYKKESNIYDAALFHCESRWLIKIDVKDFFDSITEVSVYRLFRNTGYSPLLSFQMARLCTRVIPNRKNDISKNVNLNKDYSFKKYNHKYTGSLPQGSPSSPMLSNLVGFKMDMDIEKLSEIYDFTYTRYADDLFLSTISDDVTRKSCEELTFKIYEILSIHGFTPNLSKTKIIPPGARKVVLGLIVNGPVPKLSKSFKSNLLQHLHFCNHESVGPVIHAKHKGFDSVIGFKNHLKGLIAYAIQIDTKFGNTMLAKFKKISWPFD